MASWYLLSQTYLQVGLIILKFHLILNYTFIIPLNGKSKILIALIYNAPFQKSKYFSWYLTNLLEFYSTRYEKVIILGHFITEAERISFRIRFTI